MKISLNWLKNYIDLSGTSTAEISAKLTMAGLEVEDIISESELYKGFLVAHVKSVIKHPNADKLSLCTVFDGKTELSVICGAPNVAENQKVVFAPIGTVIPKGNVKIEKVKIRGADSFGMICSEAELVLSDNHSGIMVLPAKCKTGSPITKELKLNDIIFEIGVTPNRPDALSHIGIARELSAILNKKLLLPKIKISASKISAKKVAAVEIEDSLNCPRYSSLVVSSVNVGESPSWLKESLRRVGLRSINNVVDITNYVMYETGQPLHAFDLERLAGRKIVVKSTKSPMAFVTLDSKERDLPTATLMICDAEKPVAIAGVMGGENSEINLNTKNILIESAYFNPSSIRRTSRALGLSTDASYRFERGTDPNNTLFAAQRTAQLISEICGGSILKDSIDIYPKKIKPKSISFREKQLDRILGYSIPTVKVKKIFSNLGFDVNQVSQGKLKLAIPTFRPDLEREIDLIEEVARIHGYDNIPTISKISVTLNKRIDESEFTDKLRSAASSLGFFEMINNPLVSERLASFERNPIQILNPQNKDMEYLRNSMLPGSLAVVARNINAGEKDLRLFELGNIFCKNIEGEIKSFSDFSESQKLIFIITGRITRKEWFSNERNCDIFDLKGAINSFLSKISLDYSVNDSYYHDGNILFEYTFTKSFEHNVLGTGGKVKKEVREKFEIDQDVYAFEFDVNSLKNVNAAAKKFVEPSKYPKVLRDFAFILDKSVKAADIISFIKENSSTLLKDVKLFDLYEGESIGIENKSLAFTLEYYADDRTLTESEIEGDFNSLIKSVTTKFNAVLRGK